MASVESIPAFMQPGVPVSQPPHLEGDPSLATEILPGPPTLASIQQAGIPKKDHKKPTVTYSYLPATDPGTTYTAHFASSVSAAPADMDGTRRKRARLDKGCVSFPVFHSKGADMRVSTGPSFALSERCRLPSLPLRGALLHVNSVESSRSQRASARSLAVVAPPSDPIVPPEATASSSHALSDFDPAHLPLDSDDPMVSRATSFHAEDSPPEVAESFKRQRPKPKDKGKGKERERDPVIKVKEEPGVVSLSGETVPSLVRPHRVPYALYGSLTLCPAQRGPLLCVSLSGRLGVLRWLSQGLPLAMPRPPNGGFGPA